MLLTSKVKLRVQALAFEAGQLFNFTSHKAKCGLCSMVGRLPQCTLEKPLAWGMGWMKKYGCLGATATILNLDFLLGGFGGLPLGSRLWLRCR